MERKWNVDQKNLIKKLFKYAKQIKNRKVFLKCSVLYYLSKDIWKTIIYIL